MSNSNEICSICKKEFPYDKVQDFDNNEMILMKIRQVITDKEGNMVPLYAIPKDKQRLVDSKYISFICNKCMR